MVNKEFFQALDLLERDKKISKELLIDSLESGLASAYKKEYGESRQIAVRLNEEKQSIKVYAHRLVVEEVENPDEQISLEEAREIKPTYKVGDVVIEDITPKQFRGLRRRRRSRSLCSASTTRRKNSFSTK